MMKKVNLILSIYAMPNINFDDELTNRANPGDFLDTLLKT